MEETERQLAEHLISEHQGGRPLALLFDYDGTLVPIVAHPGLAVLPAEVRGLLQRLAGKPGVALGFLSGRSLRELQAMVGLANGYYAGAGGLEVDLQGAKHTPAEMADGRRLMQSLLTPLRNTIRRFPGAWEEDKELAIAVHYRAVAADLVPELLDKVEQILAPLRGRLQVLSGPMALEINPDLGWDKGTALRMMVEHVGPRTLPLYAGDSANDLAAVETVLALGGFAVWVGGNPPGNATLALRDPGELIGFLGIIDRGIGRAAPAPMKVDRSVSD